MITLFLILGLFFSALLPIIFKENLNKQSLLFFVSLFIPIGFFGLLLSKSVNVFNGGVFKESLAFVPSLGVDFNYLIDGISLPFLLLISGIGILIYVYAYGYLKGDKKLSKFYMFLGVFMVAMIGVCISDNLLTMFVFWEITSISSFFLIGYKTYDKASQKSALQALAITGGGGLFLLGGIIILQFITGSFVFTEIIEQKELILSSEWTKYAIFFILIGAATKSAQFPFYFWLPGAMKAPTPVSAYLHSATMVKAGVYLVLRLNPLFSEIDLWQYSLLFLGCSTMIIGAVLSVFYFDLKKILAYTTISALGILFFLTGIGTEKAIMAAMIFVVVHALYKSTLFMVAGGVDLSFGTRNIKKLSGIFKAVPFLVIAAVLASLSNAGIPPFFGFLGKDLIYEAVLHSPIDPKGLMILALITNIFIGAAGYIVAFQPLFRNKNQVSTPIKSKPSFFLILPPLITASLSLVFGLIPSFISDYIATPSIVAFNLYGSVSPIHLKLWHGFNNVLILSLTTIVSGVIVYILVKKIILDKDKSELNENISVQYFFEKIKDLLRMIATVFTNNWQNGYLRNYVLVILISIMGLLSFELLDKGNFTIMKPDFSDIGLYEYIIYGIVVVSVFFTLISGSRLTAIASVGVLGYGIALLFVFYSAPDLAMTQFTIDTLTVILFMLVLSKLPTLFSISPKSIKIRDSFIAAFMGVIISIIVLIILNEKGDFATSKYYIENSYTLAKGKNIVNVILVDFRGLDTMGEITVLAIAAIGVFSLLKLRLRKQDI